MLKKKSSVAKQQRRKLSPEFKAKVALAALRDDKMLEQLCAEFQVRSTQISDRKRQFMEHAMEGFARGRVAVRLPAIDVVPLHAKIGELTLEMPPASAGARFLERALTKEGLLGARG